MSRRSCHLPGARLPSYWALGLAAAHSRTSGRPLSAAATTTSAASSSRYHPLTAREVVSLERPQGWVLPEALRLPRLWAPGPSRTSPASTHIPPLRPLLPHPTPSRLSLTLTLPPPSCKTRDDAGPTRSAKETPHPPSQGPSRSHVCRAPYAVEGDIFPGSGGQGVHISGGHHSAFHAKQVSARSPSSFDTWCPAPCPERLPPLPRGCPSPQRLPPQGQ